MQSLVGSLVDGDVVVAGGAVRKVDETDGETALRDLALLVRMLRPRRVVAVRPMKRGGEVDALRFADGLQRLAVGALDLGVAIIDEEEAGGVEAVAVEVVDDGGERVELTEDAGDLVGEDLGAIREEG